MWSKRPADGDRLFEVGGRSVSGAVLLFATVASYPSVFQCNRLERDGYQLLSTTKKIASTDAAVPCPL